tara:strand:+ start:2475 stop:3410 length:936 start_codon:yes stop_codon:yes gene_type:complete
MNIGLFFLVILLVFIIIFYFTWLKNDRSFNSIKNVADSYDDWTNDFLLEGLWGEHIHLGYYKSLNNQRDFREAKTDFVHELIHWSGLNKLPSGSRILDIGCGIGGSARILSDHYGFDVLGITISSAQVNRARQLTPIGLRCRFELMDALDLQFGEGSFDGIWSVEAGPHMQDKQRYADEMLRVLRPGGVLAVADWNCRESSEVPLTIVEKIILNQLLNQWTHPEFSTINGFRNNLLNSAFNGGFVEVEDWTKFTLPSWNDSILEGIRRPQVIFRLGGNSLLKSLREIPTILLMRWAFASGLMQFGVFRSRG